MHAIMLIIITIIKVEGNVFAMCQRCQLTEDQRFDLINSVRVMFGGISSPAMQSPSNSSRLSPGGAFYHHSQSSSSEDNVDNGIELEYATVVRPNSSSSDTTKIDNVKRALTEKENNSPVQVLDNHMQLSNVMEEVAVQSSSILSHEESVNKEPNTKSGNQKVKSTAKNKTSNSTEERNLLSYFLFQGMSSTSKSNSTNTNKNVPVALATNNNNSGNDDGNNKEKLKVNASVVQLKDTPSSNTLPKSIEFDDDFAIL